MATAKLSERQTEILAFARRTGGIHRINRLWGIAPAAVHALIRKGYLEMNGTNFAQITDAGRAAPEGRTP